MDVDPDMDADPDTDAVDPDFNGVASNVLETEEVFCPSNVSETEEVLCSSNMLFCVLYNISILKPLQ